MYQHTKVFCVIKYKDMLDVQETYKSPSLRSRESLGFSITFITSTPYYKPTITNLLSTLKLVSYDQIASVFVWLSFSVLKYAENKIDAK